MEKVGIDDTIAAISTPPGEGGIGIVRLSGKEALKIADKIFRSPHGKKPSEQESHTTHYGHIVAAKETTEKKGGQNSGEIIDEVLLTVMRSPRTYTREDIVEINCHGGIVPLKRVLDLVLEHGIRMAEPGEFTRRAFMNGRIDLIQAEAVLDVIRARTDLCLKAAMCQLEGALSRQIREVRGEVLDLLSETEAAIDFPDEELEIIPAERTLSRLKKVKEGITRLLTSADSGQILRDGIITVICGKRNVGKSSLMNALLRRDRVIVSPIPGTTRDVIEEVINVEGIPLRIFDTAGIVETTDLVEKEGVSRSKHYLKQADLVLVVLDGNDKISEEDEFIIRETGGKKTVIVINKIDLPAKIDTGRLRNLLGNRGNGRVVRISATVGTGLDSLEKAIFEIVWKGEVFSQNTALITNVRHLQALKSAGKSAERALNVLEEKQPPECAAVDLRETLDFLGEIVGETTTEDVLENIFSRFCIGK